MLIDTHAHLTDPRYAGAREIIDGMDADGLERIITVGFNEFTSAYAVRIAEENEKIYAAVGVHPSDAADAGQGYIGTLRDLAESEKCVAIGEIGLDYHYEDTDKDAQHRVLAEQIELARILKLPAMFHVRDAYGDFMNTVRRCRDSFAAGAIMHCFSGSKEVALACVDMGFYISFSGSATFKNSHAGEIIAALPADRILIETDCPYLAPVPHRGELNYPKYVRFQAEKVAEARGISAEEAGELTAANAYRAFPKMKPPARGKSL